jgi:hypothetical protein
MTDKWLSNFWQKMSRRETAGGEQGLAAMPEPGGEERLDGWKRIAAYMNRDVRTVRRWEKNQGLPVRRLMHDKLATVYAYRSELDTWLQQQETSAQEKASLRASTSSKPVRRWAWLIAVTLGLAGVFTWYWPSHDEPPISFGEWDWVLVTQFENRTGEELLDGIVEYALQRELANSRYLKVAPRGRIDDALRLMRLPPDTPLDVSTGRDA